MESVQPGMEVLPNDALPVLPEVAEKPWFVPIPELEVPVLIIGGGPAGLSAAIELGKAGIHVLLVDDNTVWAASWYCKHTVSWIHRCRVCRYARY